MEIDFILTSPSISSPSSSDLDSESTGSFFHDRSTSLGALMGVRFPLLETPPPPPEAHASAPRSTCERRPATEGTHRRSRRRGRGSGWWRLCREEEEDEDLVGSTSLAEFLQVERQLGDQFRYDGEGSGMQPLFENGRVLPPTVVKQRARPQQQGRLPVLMAAICIGG